MPNSTSPFEHSYALIVGINAYGHGIEPLNNAVNDAAAIATLLETQHGYTVWRLFDQNASYETIQDYLTTHLPKHIQKNDRLLFYFSGHGIQLTQSDGPEGYLIPQTAHLGQSDTYLPMHEVSQALNKLPCRHLLAILDCCFAGSFRWSSQQRKAEVIGGAPLYKEKYDRFIRDNAWQVLTSAAHDQLAYDAFDFKNDRGQDKSRPQNSPFATTLLDALAGAADMSPPAKHPGDTPGDGVTTATELYQYLRDTIEPPTDAKGTPQTPELCPLSKHGKGEYIFLIPEHNLNLPAAPSLDRSTNPYKGLASFDESDHDRYFGRKNISQDLHKFFQQHQLTVVLGPSGSGKSSLVKAGLLPRLRQKDTGSSWTILPPFRPGNSPFQALNQILTQLSLPPVKPRSSASASSGETTLEHPLLPEVGLEQWFKQHTGPLVVVIDQFEELITRCEDEERQQFLNTLAIAFKTYPQKLRAIITLRSDFESQFQDSPLASFWQASRFQISALTRKELRQAIEAPAAQRVLFFNPPELVDRLIDEIINMPGSLPLLSFALSELYLRYLDRQEVASKQSITLDRAITEEDYGALGGVTLALIQRAEAEYQQLETVDAAYAHTIKQVMLRMVAFGSGGLARRPLLASEQQFTEPEHSRVQTVLNHFLDSRLLVAGKTIDHESFVEPAHDALVRGWPRLNQWIKQKEIQETVLLIRSLTSVTDQWIKNQTKKASQGLLWKDDPRLSQALQLMCGSSHPKSHICFNRWLSRKIMVKLKAQKIDFWGSLSQSVWLNAKEEKFVKDSLACQYRNRLKQYGITTVVISGLIILVGVAWIQRNIATKERNIFDIKSQSDRALTWISTERSIDGLALAISALQRSMQYPRVQIDAQRAIVAAVQNAREQHRLSDHKESVQTVVYSPDSQYIASGSADKKIKIWKAATGKLLHSIDASQGGINAIAFSSNSQQLVSAGEDTILRLWDLTTGQQIEQDLSKHTGPVRSVDWSHKSQKIASGSDDKTLRIWDINSGQEKVIPHEEKVLAVAISPNGLQIASGSSDGTVRLWNAETGELIDKPMKGHTDSVFSVAFNADGTKLVSGSADRTLRRWDTRTREQVGESLRGHSDQIYAVKFSPDDRYIVSAGVDRSIRLWDAANGEVSGQILDAHRNFIRSIDVNPKSSQIVSSSADRSIRLWDIRSRMPTGQPLISDHERSIISSALSPNNKYLASADESGKVKRWEVNVKRQRPVDIGQHDEAAASVTISPDSQRIASTSYDGTLRIWDIETKAKIHQLPGHSGRPIYSAAFHPYGKIVASAGGDNNIILWDSIRGQQIEPPLTAHDSSVFTVRFSPYGRYMVSGGKGKDKNLILWDARKREPIQILKGHADDVRSVAFSHDGKKIASGSSDNTIIIWNTQTGQKFRRLEGHTNTVWSVQFSPKSSNLLASGSNDRTVRLWNIEQEQQIGPSLEGHTGSVRSVLFNQEGTSIYSVGADLSLRVWPTSWQEWPKMACERIKYHPILNQPELIFEQNNQDSIDIAEQAKVACEQAFWEDE